MNTSENPAQQKSTPDFDSMVQQVLVKWRQLSPGEKNDRTIVKQIIRDDFFDFHLFPRNRDVFEEHLNAALTQEGYTGELFEALHETRVSIARCKMAGLIDIE